MVIFGSLFRRRMMVDVVTESARKQYEAFSDREGWFPVINDPWRPQAKRPQDFGSIEITRKEWNGPQRVAWKDIPPELNSEGLYWRPVEE